MIVELISKYLESNKRLVVPNLGAFIVKEAGRVVLFSNLIKGDDGVLRSLLVEAGVSELETAAALDRRVSVRWLWCVEVWREWYGVSCRSTCSER